MPNDPGPSRPRGEHWLDRLAKRLAARSSRRATLARAGAGLLGGVLASLLPRRIAAYGLIFCTPGVIECPAGTECIAGMCLQPYRTSYCPTGLTQCGGQCVNTQLDPNHCGNCTTQCPYGVPCSFGACTIEILPAPAPACANTVTDPNNCGRCGNVCPAPANAAATCANSLCGFVCLPGFKPCNGLCIPIASCCTPADCPSGPPSATVTCTNGQCGYSCPAVVDNFAPDGGSAPTTAVSNAALADLARLPPADGEFPRFNTGIPCCLSSDCLGINGTLLPFLRSQPQPSIPGVSCGIDRCVCMSGTCFLLAPPP